MTDGAPPRAGTAAPERVLYRQRGGELYDARQRQRVGLDELAQEVGAGGQFRVYDQVTGNECTYHVLSEVVVQAGTDSLAALADPGPAIGHLARYLYSSAPPPPAAGLSD